MSERKGTVRPATETACTDTEITGTLLPRHRQVLAGLACGQTQAEIARKLNLAPSTVGLLVDNAMGLLGARTVTHAVVIALTQRLISVEAAES